MRKRLANRCIAPLLAVIAALLSVVDISTLPLWDRLQRVRDARLVGLGWLDAFRFSGLPVISGAAAVAGKGAVWKIDDSAGTLRDISGDVSSVDFPEEVGTAETTGLGASARSFIPTLKGATASVQGFFNSAATTGSDTVLSGLVGLATSSTFEFGPEGSATGKIRYTGESYVTRYQKSAPVDGVVSFSLDLQVTGAVTRNTWP